MILTLINSMIMTLITMSFFLYFFTSHPMSIAVMVISQSILMASLISKKMLFSWFGFFIFIIYLGGILMLFSYIISLINSKKTLFSINKSIYTTFLIFFSLNLFKEKKSFLEIYPSKFTKLIMSTFSLSSMKLSIFLMMFLLLIMVMVVYMTEMSKGNMRKI
uniref:NADH dehydrogenase subunit 6 n=1 Tax=Thrips setosus TaxID=163897 RepID=A0A8K1VK84_9NEOP|nr:NADH dehydrogenase subunit 6 [Thrips setosus]